jgi:predicted AlkP superfamily pyrophosphatase or phosphodiesterase
MFRRYTQILSDGNGLFHIKRTSQYHIKSILWPILISFLSILTISVGIAVVFGVRYKTYIWTHTKEQWSNRTTLIVFALDGFRYDYIQKFAHKCPNIKTRLLEGSLNSRRKGVSANLYPIFPSKPATNLVTLSTGMYPGDHGILNKNVYNPKIPGFIFSMESADRSSESLFQNMEPIWVTLEKHNYKTVVQYMPGSNVKINGTSPTHYESTFLPNSVENYRPRLDTVISLIDAEKVEDRPYFALLYFSLEDYARQYGPFSVQMRERIENFDIALGYFLDALEERNITQYIDIVVASVTGMAQISAKSVIYLEDIYAAGVDPSQSPFLNPNTGNKMGIMEMIFVSNHGTVLDLNPQIYNQNETLAQEYIDYVYVALVNGKNNPNFNHFEIYKKAEIPSEYHYQLNTTYFPDDYTPKILITAHEGWMITTRDKAYYGQAGDDGYHNQTQTGPLSGFFVANGPHFKSDGSLQPTVSVLDMYQLMTTIFNVSSSSYNKGDVRNVSYLFDPEFLSLLNSTAPPQPTPSPPQPTPSSPQPTSQPTPSPMTTAKSHP